MATPLPTRLTHHLVSGRLRGGNTGKGIMEVEYRRYVRVWLALTLGLALHMMGCSGPATRKPGEPIQLTILHTNDIHGVLEAEPASWLPDKTPVGGFKALDGWVRKIKGEAPNTLLLDGGDLLTGGPAAALTFKGVFGGGMFELLNRMGYDAWTPGNHDLDKGITTLLPALDLLQMPVVNANLLNSRGRALAEQFKTSQIIERGGLRIGVVGLMTDSLGRVLTSEQMVGITVESANQAAKREVAHLDPLTDIIIFITHQGVESDQAMARAVPGIDVIVGAHSHTRLQSPLVENGTLIVQAGSHLKNLGRLDLVISGDRVVTHYGRLILLRTTEEINASPDVSLMVDELHTLVEKSFGEVLGELVTPWQTAGGGESNIGNWLTDQLREAAHVDFAMLNSGGIRKSLPAGPVTKGDLFAVVPFDNTVCTFSVTGDELLRIIHHNAVAASRESYGILQVSGLSYRWSQTPERVVVEEVLVGGKPLELTRNYTGATNDYILFSQAEKYLGLVPKVRERQELPIQMIVVEGFKAAGKVDARVEGRIVEVEQ